MSKRGKHMHNKHMHKQLTTQHTARAHQPAHHNNQLESTLSGMPTIIAWYIVLLLLGVGPCPRFPPAPPQCLLLHFEEGLISPHFFAASPPEHSLRPKAHHKAGVEGPPGPPAKI